MSLEDLKRVYSTTVEKAPFMVSMDRLFGEKTFEVKLKWMTIRELIELKNRWSEILTNTRDEAQRLEAESNIFDATMHFHSKFASSFSVISFAVLAIPLGIRSSRKETSANLFLALGLGLAFLFDDDCCRLVWPRFHRAASVPLLASEHFVSDNWILAAL